MPAADLQDVAWPWGWGERTPSVALATPPPLSALAHAAPWARNAVPRISCRAQTPKVSPLLTRSPQALPSNSPGGRTLSVCPSSTVASVPLPPGQLPRTACSVLCALLGTMDTGGLPGGGAAIPGCHPTPEAGATSDDAEGTEGQVRVPPTLRPAVRPGPSCARTHVGDGAAVGDGALGGHPGAGHALADAPSGNRAQGRPWKTGTHGLQGV